MNTGIIAEKIVTIPRIKDRIKIEIVSGYAQEYCWIAYRENGCGGWEKIPAMSRNECHRFPKSIGYAAQAFLRDTQHNLKGGQ